MFVSIREATERDAEGIAEIYAPIVSSTATSFETTPPSTAEMAARIRETSERLPWLVCERDGAVEGYAYASPHHDRPAYRWTVDVSVYVRDRSQRAGVGQGLYEALIELLRRQGYCNALAVIALPNDASVAFHESFGFERVGVYRNVGYKLGSWHDVGHWQHELRSHNRKPAEPIPISAVRDKE